MLHGGEVFGANDDGKIVIGHINLVNRDSLMPVKKIRGMSRALELTIHVHQD
ncbi:MAG: hypothetical protein ACLP29_06835 [Dissulfurispiraceae bacterium]|jgi:hypothetical protein